jgi:SAM-dependent methyltransferase
MTARAFMSAGAVRRPNATCPRCASAERQRLMWLYVTQRGLIPPETRLLHVAPERSLSARLRALPGIDYVSGDLSGTGMLRLDVTDLSAFPDGSFDAIICSHVLEHVLEDRRAMAELARVLRCGGWAILLVPIDAARATTFEDSSVTDPRERLRLFGQEDHVRVYGRDFPDRLHEAGFQVTADDFAATILSAEADRYRIDRGELIYLCRL